MRMVKDEQLFNVCQKWLLKKKISFSLVTFMSVKFVEYLVEAKELAIIKLTIGATSYKYEGERLIYDFIVMQNMNSLKIQSCSTKLIFALYF